MEFQHPQQMQTFVDQFIFDVRLRQPSAEDFCQMYSDDLYCYVKIVTELCSDSNRSSIEVMHTSSILENLRAKDLMRYVIISTHFQKYIQTRDTPSSQIEFS